MNKDNIQTYRLEVEERTENYVNERVQKIDSIIADLQNRANLLKKNLQAQQFAALQKLDSFIEQCLSSEKYDYLINEEKLLNFSEIVPLKFSA